MQCNWADCLKKDGLGLLGLSQRSKSGQWLVDINLCLTRCTQTLHDVLGLAQRLIFTMATHLHLTLVCHQLVRRTVINRHSVQWQWHNAQV